MARSEAQWQSAHLRLEAWRRAFPPLWPSDWAGLTVVRVELFGFFAGQELVGVADHVGPAPLALESLSMRPSG